MRFRRALDRGNVTEALSAASELDFVSLAEALELTKLPCRAPCKAEPSNRNGEGLPQFSRRSSGEFALEGFWEGS
jgi:hypothetical protein